MVSGMMSKYLSCLLKGILLPWPMRLRQGSSLQLLACLQLQRHFFTFKNPLL